MTPGTHNIGQIRDHAESVSATSPTLPSSLSLPTRAETMKAMNRLKLSLYIQELDGTSLDIVSDADTIGNWVKDHTVEVQVLLNTMGGLSLSEDGIRGPNTVGAINDILGIDIPISTSSTPVIVAGTLSTSPSVAGEASISLPDFLQNEAQARAIIEALGIEGVRIENGQLIGINELNTQEKLRKLAEYLDYANYIENGQVTPEGLMTRYKELLDYPTNFITDKKYLIMKYSAAIYSEILKAGYIIRLGGTNGEYVITERSDRIVIHNSDFQEFVSEPSIRTEYIEFARLNSIVGEANSYWNERMVTRQGLVQRILETNGIVQSALGGIQSVESLLLNKVEVVKQLKKSANELANGRDRNMKQYEELVWLLDFLENEQYQQVDTQINLFDNVNHYNKVFLQEKALIDALTAEGIDPNSTELDDDIMSRLERVLGKNSPALYLLGIVMMLFSDTRKWGVGVILGTMAAKIGLNIAGDTVSAVGLTDSGGIRGDLFDMFDPINLKHIIKYPEGFDRINYDPTLTALYAVNDTQRADGEIVNGVAIQHTTNAKIALIFQETLKNDTLLNTEYSSADSDTLAQTIFDGMGTRTISEASFDSRVPRDQQGEVELNDVKVFLKLLRDQEDSGEDTTIGDLLYANEIDKFNHEYDSTWIVQFTESGDTIDPLIHNVFRTAWNDTTATRESRRDIFKVLTAFDSYLYSGFGDTIQDVWSVSGAGAALAGPSLGDKIAKIGDLKNLLNNSNLDSGMKDSLKNILVKYEELLQKEDEFEVLRMSWYDKGLTTRVSLVSIFDDSTTEVEYTTIQNSLDQNINDLNTLITGLPSHDMYNVLRARITREISWLTGERERVQQLILNLKDYESIMQGGVASEDLMSSDSIASVTTVTNGIQSRLRASIDTGNSDLFGSLNHNFQTNIIGFYNGIQTNTINGVNSTTNASIDIWNGMKKFLVDKLSNIPGIANVIDNIGAVGSIPSGVEILSTGNIDTSSIVDIEAQIKLAIIQQYFTQNKNDLAHMANIAREYKLTLGGISSLNPEQQALKTLLNNNYEQLLRDIENQVKTFTESYRGGEINDSIARLDTNLSVGNIADFQTIARFIKNFQSMDTTISLVQTQVNEFFDSPNSLDTILIPLTTIQANYNAKLVALQSSIEQSAIVDINDSSSTPGSVAQENNVATIQENIDLLTQLQTLIGISASREINATIPKWRERLFEVATVNEMPEVQAAIDADIASLATDVISLTTKIATFTSSPTPEEMILLNNKKTELDEKTALLTVLRDAIDSIPFTLTLLKSSLTNPLGYTPGIGSTTSRAFNSSYTTVFQVLNTL